MRIRTKSSVEKGDTKYLVLACRIIAFTITLFSSTSSSAVDTLPGPFSANVLRVIQGDTLYVEAQPWETMPVTETKVRIAGVYTPDSRGRCQNERNLARRARRLVEDALWDGEVKLFDVRHATYASRVVARVEVDGVDLARALIEGGLGRPVTGHERVGWCD